MLEFFKKYMIPYSWATLYVGRQLSLVDWRELENYAAEYLEHDTSCKDSCIAELAYGVDESQSDELLKKILKTMNQQLEKDCPLWNVEKRKWRYLLLQKLKEMLHDPFNFSQGYRNIYAHFGYPEDMWDFLYNVSPTDGYTHSLEKNIKIDETKLDAFLAKEKKKIDEQSPDWPSSDYYPPL